MSIVPRRLAVLSSFVVLVGCAELAYVKVPTPTQYSDWSDADQRKADAMEGVRYYLPRPFLHLKRSIPVAQRVAFVSFVRKEDGYELVQPVDPPTWLSRAMPQKLSFAQALAAMTTTEEAEETEDDDEGPRLQSGQPGEDEDDAPEEAEEGPEEAERPATEVTGRTGFINDTDPVTKLSDTLDVVYLPDFEEQYVIQPRGAFGKQDVETRLRHGWAAEVFSQQVDNSNLIPYVLRQVEQASETAAGVATQWGWKIATGGAVSVPSLEGYRTESAKPGRSAEDVLGESLLFKVVEVKLAQPGLYPILKPRETAHWLGTDLLVSGEDPQETFELALQQANLPWVRPDMAFIPCPPFTMVGFNVTTDVFLVPATERIRLEATTKGGVSPDPTEKDGKDSVEERRKSQVTEKLVKKRSALELLEEFVDDGTGIEVGPADDMPSKTEITVKKGTEATLADLPEITNADGEIEGNIQEEIQAWIDAALGSEDGESVPIQRIEKVASAVRIVVSAPLSQLADD